MQHKIFCVREFIKTESPTVVQRAFRLRFNIQPPTRKSICRWNHQFEQIGCLSPSFWITLYVSHTYTTCNIIQKCGFYSYSFRFIILVVIIQGDSKRWTQLNSKRRLNTRQTVGCGIPSSLLALPVDLRGLRSKLFWIRLTFSSDTSCRPELLSLHRQPICSNWWLQRHENNCQL